MAENGQPERHFRRSESIAQLAAALAAAQGEMTGARKDSANPYYKSKYADLASVIEAIRGPLAKNGLAYMQFPRAVPDGIEVETVLCHSSGEWVSETLRLPAVSTYERKDGSIAERFDSQTCGSAITYARRYGLQSITGVAAEDDDGHAAMVNANGLRDKSLPILKAAAAKGLVGLEKAWKALTNEARTAIGKETLDALKKEAEAVTPPS